MKEYVVRIVGDFNSPDQDGSISIHNLVAEEGFRLRRIIHLPGPCVVCCLIRYLEMRWIDFIAGLTNHCPLDHDFDGSAMCL